MKCSKCGIELPEREIQLSHDVPCYLFWMKGKKHSERKQFADKYKSRWLCAECHCKYELWLIQRLIECAKEQSETYWEEKA